MVFDLEATAFPLCSFAAFETGSPWLDSTDHAHFVGQAEAWLDGKLPEDEEPSGSVPDRIAGLWWPNDEPRRTVLGLFHGMAERHFCLDKDGFHRMPVAFEDVAAVRKRFSLGLIEAFAVASISSEGGISLPTDYAPATVGTEEISQELDRGLTDAHVHLGASIPIEGLVFLALCNIEQPSRERAQTSRVESVEGTYRLDYLLICAKYYLTLLTDYLEHLTEYTSYLDYVGSNSDIGEGLRRSLQSDAICQDLLQHSRIRPETGTLRKEWELATVCQLHNELASELLMSWRTGANSRLPGVHIRDLWSRLFFHFLSHEDDEAFMRDLTSLVRLFCIIYRWIIPDRGRLEKFTRTFFGHYRSVRTTATVTLRDLVGYGVANLATQSCVHQTAMRFSVQRQSTRPRLRDSEVLTCMSECLSAYHEALGVDHISSGFEVVFPITLLRREDTQGCPNMGLSGKQPCRFQFGHLWQTIEVVADMFSRCPEARYHFGIIDVAGNEAILANWVFALLLDEFEHRLAPRPWGERQAAKINQTFHAGEDFDSPLQGLRRVAEVIKHMPSVTRLGHAMAIAPNSSLLRWQSSENTHELLDDLVWAWDRTRVTNSTLAAKLSQQAGVLTEQLYGHQYATEFMLQAYKLRFTREPMGKIGLLVRGTAEGTYQYDGRVRRAHHSATLNPLVVLSEYLTNRDFGTRTEELRGHKELLSEAYKQICGETLKTIEEKGLVVEACPTSNCVIGRTPTYAQHPMFELTVPDDRNVIVTLNSDDPGLFSVTIVEEYLAIWEASAAHIRSKKKRKTWLGNIRSDGGETWFRTSDPDNAKSRASQCLTAIENAKSLPG